MWTHGWRDAIWKRLEEPWDLIVIGGGITGAGILAEATKLGLRTLLLEARDFASGTSSRSTKLVHGGLRYLRNAQLRLTRESVRERELLVDEAEGLVSRLGFYLTSFESDGMPTWMFGAGLAIYDVLAKKWAHERCRPEELVLRVPALRGAPLRGGYHYFDAQTDDARLTLRVIRESVARGGVALNYASVDGLLKTSNGRVRGVAVVDRAPEHAGRTAEVKARAVVNATGAWADDVRAHVGGGRRLRKIRGSHLVFSRDRLPLPEAISLLHPRDERAVFAVPWEGATIFGTTDVDHDPASDVQAKEPAMSDTEAEYLLQAVRHAFPELDLGPDDVMSTFAGVRAVVDTGASDPSKESREHVLWQENGLLTVTGGKLTTFRLMAREALTTLREHLFVRPPEVRSRILDDVDSQAEELSSLEEGQRTRLLGRHGREATEVLRAGGGALEPIAGSNVWWAELQWAARAEGVVHLEDLLLRRARLGFLLPDGGLRQIEEVRQIAQPELGWSDERWTQEVEAYRTTWKEAYGPKR